MPFFKVKKFNGMLPAISPRLLPNDAAQQAEDIDFVSGRLEPVKEDLTIATSPTSASTRVNDIFRYEYDVDEVSTSNPYIVKLSVGSDGNDETVRNVGFLAANGMPLFGLARPIAKQLSGIYVSSILNPNTGNTVYELRIVVDKATSAIYETPINSAPAYFGSNVQINFFTSATDDGDGTFSSATSALSNAPSISDMDNVTGGGAELSYRDLGDTQIWTKTIDADEFNAISGQIGNDIFVKFTNSSVSSITTISLGNVNKSYAVKSSLRSGRSFTGRLKFSVDKGLEGSYPTRYIAADYNGRESSIFVEYIKIPGNQLSKLQVGATLKADIVSSGVGAREAEILYFKFDGVDTLIYFKREHFLQSGSYNPSSGNVSATLLVDDRANDQFTTGENVLSRADDKLIGYTVTNYGLPNRASTDSENPLFGTSRITDSDSSDTSATLDFVITGHSNSLRSDESGKSQYTISSEPNLTKHTGAYSYGSNDTYWKRFGIDVCFGGLYNSIKLLRSANLLDSSFDYTGVTNSGIEGQAGLGFEPYFSTIGTQTTKSMLRSALHGTISGGTTGGARLNDSFTVGRDLTYFYGAPIYKDVITSRTSNTVFTCTRLSTNSTGSASNNFRDGNFNEDDILNGLRFHNLTTGASSLITDYDASADQLTIATLSGGINSNITVGDEFMITAGSNIYNYKWTCYHRNHPFAKLAGAPGNMGVVLTNTDALTSDQVTDLDTDRTATDDLSGNITLTEGDVVQFKGFGVDATRTLQNNVNNGGTGSNQTTGPLNGQRPADQSGDNVFFEDLPHSNAGHNGGDSDADFYRMVFYNMNWRRFEGEGITQARAESHEGVFGLSDFDAMYGGPYWQIISKPVKVHVKGGLLTVIGTGKTVVTGHVESVSASGNTLTITDTTKNFDPLAEYLYGKTIVNVHTGVSSTIIRNSKNNLIIDTTKSIFYDLTNKDKYYEHIAADQTGVTVTGTTSFPIKSQYYILEPIDSVDILGGQTLTRDFFTFSALSLASMDGQRQVYTEQTASQGVMWFCSRPGTTAVSVDKKTKSKQTSFLEFEESSEILRSPVGSDIFNRLYWTGDGFPRVIGGDFISSSVAGDPLISYATWSANSYRLGIPTPEEAPLVKTNVSGALSNLTNVSEVLSVSYVYTYVSAFGEEGPPSPPSTPILTQIGGSITITNIGTKDANFAESTAPYNFGVGALKRIYRSNSGSADTFFQFVDEIPFSQNTYSDVKPPAVLGEVLPSSTWIGPPDDNAELYPDGPMRGLTEFANGSFAGFTGKRLCFSEPFLPHAWPVAYRHTLDDDIIALSAIANGIFVLTRAKPYFFGGNDPSAMAPQQLDFAHGCINRNSVVDMGEVIMYAAADGLCALSLNGGQVISEGIINVDNWVSEYQADTYTAHRHEGKYVALFTASNLSGPIDGFVADVRNQETAFSTIQREANTTAIYHDEGADNIYILEKNEGAAAVVKLFRGKSTKEQYRWKSKKFTLGYPISLSWVGIHADSYPTHSGTLSDDTAGLFKVSDDAAGSAASATNVALQIKVFADGVLLAHYALSKNSSQKFVQETLVPNNIQDTVILQPVMRLPNNTATEWEVEILGTSPVNEFYLAQSMAEVVNE
mgnify:CR=1 FL=1